MPTFYVTKETTCKRCEGRQIIQDPIWTEYWKWADEFKAKNNRLPNKDEDRAWWAVHGYFEWKPAGVGGIPSEECACFDCNGTGVLVEKVSLADALRELGFSTHTGLPASIQEALNSGDGTYRP